MASASARHQAEAARTAARALTYLLSSTERCKLLHAVADALVAPASQNAILRANHADVAAATAARTAPALISRLHLSASKLEGLATVC
jgi:gamma-glutamyl phosphate reductase